MTSCIYHTDSVLAFPDDDGGTGSDASVGDATFTSEGGAALGEGGTGTPREGGSTRDASSEAATLSPYDISIETSPFLGKYLADRSGRTLYTFGADLVGDCNTPPLSTCEADCLIAWPIFDGGARTLAPTLDDRAFGTMQRADGKPQATYYGWPLYYYKSDPVRGVITGQGKSKTWNVATVTLPGLVVMKSATQKYLADAVGRTLYTFDQDTPGSATSNPVSACAGTCLDAYRPMLGNRITVVSALDINDFSLFVRPGAEGQQVAFKGAPLYYATADMKSGDVNGALVAGWAVVVQ
jgi:predicted lipoprotein with Yx(FWY)xxD motif